MEDVNRIPVVSRMTTYCRKAVHYGISLSKRYSASLYIIHVVHNPFGLEGWNRPSSVWSIESDKTGVHGFPCEMAIVKF